jgi:hypothetical protein
MGRQLHHSYEQYLAALEVSGVKLEYCEGEIYAMAGGMKIPRSSGQHDYATCC